MELSKKRTCKHKWKNKFGPGGPLALPGSLSSTGYFNPIKNPQTAKNVLSKTLSYSPPSVRIKPQNSVKITL
jgi:hypothetical protein